MTLVVGLSIPDRVCRFFQNHPSMRSTLVFLRAVSLGVLVLCASHAQAQSLPEVVQQALAKYPSIVAAQARAEAARAEIGRARSQHFPQISLGAGHNSYSSGQVPSSLGRNTYAPAAKVNLWSGGRIEAEAERAQALTQSSESQGRVTLDEVALQASEAYLNWLRMLDLSELADRNLQAHNDTLEDIRKIAQADMGRRIDLEQAQVRVDNARLAVQLRHAERLQAVQKLRRFWDGTPGVPPGDSDQVFTQGPLASMPASLEQALERITDDFPGIAQYKAQVLAAEAAIRQAKALYWPTVDLVSSRAFNANTLRFETLTQVQMNMQVFNGQATSAQVESAVAQLRSAQASLDEARLVVREKVALAWQEWASARSRAELGRSQSSVGDKVVEGYRLQFRLARRSLLDLLNIQADTFNYHSAARAAVHDERLARARLLASIGDLAQRFAPGNVTPAAPESR